MLRAYSIPGLAYSISDYLNVRDEMALDCTCWAIHTANREHVYPRYDNINLDEVAYGYPEKILRAYLRKLAPHVQQITSDYNNQRILLPMIANMPKLETVRYAVPLILDITMRRIHPDTFRFWIRLRAFLNSVAHTPNVLKKLEIVPGEVVLVHTNPGEDDYVDEHVLRDNTEGSHLHAFRHFHMPVVLILDYPEQMNIELRAPTYLINFASKKFVHTDWSDTSTGTLSRMLELV
jgi:hypothetical protein